MYYNNICIIIIDMYLLISCVININNNCIPNLKDIIISGYLELIIFIANY